MNSETRADSIYCVCYYNSWELLTQFTIMIAGVVSSMIVHETTLLSNLKQSCICGRKIKALTSSDGQVHASQVVCWPVTMDRLAEASCTSQVTAWLGSRLGFAGFTYLNFTNITPLTTESLRFYAVVASSAVTTPEVIRGAAGKDTLTSIYINYLTVKISLHLLIRTKNN